MHLCWSCLTRSAAWSDFSSTENLVFSFLVSLTRSSKFLMAFSALLLSVKYIFNVFLSIVNSHKTTWLFLLISCHVLLISFVVALSAEISTAKLPKHSNSIVRLSSLIFFILSKICCSTLRRLLSFPISSNLPSFVNEVKITVSLNCSFIVSSTTDKYSSSYLKIKVKRVAVWNINSTYSNFRFNPINLSSCLYQQILCTILVMIFATSSSIFSKSVL